MTTSPIAPIKLNSSLQGCIKSPSHLYRSYFSSMQMAPSTPTEQIKTLWDSYVRAAERLSTVTEKESYILNVNEVWDELGTVTSVHRYEGLSKMSHFAVFLTLNAAVKYVKAYTAHLDIPPEGIQEFLDENDDLRQELFKVIDDVLPAL